MLRGLELRLRLGGVVVQRVQLAQQQLGIQVVRLQPRNGLVLADCRLQHLGRLRALHIAQQAHIHLPQQGVGLHIVGVALHLVLGRGDCLLNASKLQVKFRKPILQQHRVRIGIKRQLVLFDRLGRVVRASGAYRHLLVQLGQTVMIVGAGTVGTILARHRRRLSRLGVALRRRRILQLLGRHTRRHQQQGCHGNQPEETNPRNAQQLGHGAKVPIRRDDGRKH